MIRAVQADPQTLLTVQLLDEAYNEKNTGIRVAACDVRIYQMQKEMGKLYKALGEFGRNPGSRKTNRDLMHMIC